MKRARITILLFLIFINSLPAMTGKELLIRLDSFYNGSLGIAGEEYIIRGEVAYIGMDKLNSLYLNWQVDNQEVNTTFFDSLDIFAYNPFYYIADTPFIPENEGDYLLQVWFTGLNGQDAEQPASDTLIIDLQVYDYLPSRQLSLLESFSSINCGSCAIISPVLTSMVKSNLDQYAMIYYHPLQNENSPLFSFNPKAQETRRDTYGVTYTPVSAVGSLYFGGSFALNEMHLEMEHEKPAAFTIEGTWYIRGGELFASVSTEAFAEITERNLRLLVAVVEDSVSFETPPGSNGEKDYFFVMRHFLPDANGTFLANQQPGWVEDVEMVIYVGEGLMDENQLSLIAFVQDLESLEIHQVVRLEHYEPEDEDPTGIDNHSATNSLKVFPNPSTGNFTLTFGENITIDRISIFNLEGKNVYLHPDTDFSSVASVNIITSGLSSGVYLLQIHSHGNIIHRKISITNN